LKQTSCTKEKTKRMQKLKTEKKGSVFPRLWNEQVCIYSKTTRWFIYISPTHPNSVTYPWNRTTWQLDFTQCKKTKTTFCKPNRKKKKKKKERLEKQKKKKKKVPKCILKISIPPLFSNAAQV
jgi:hypothetical protein